jgi:N-acetylneuraminate synthase
MMNNTCKVVKADEAFFDTFFTLRCEEKNIYWTGYDHKSDRANLQQWYLDQLVRKDREILKITFNNLDIGYMYLDMKNKYNYEISYAISEIFEGKGIASKAINEVIKYTRSKKHPLMIRAYVAETCLGSAKVLFKSKFVKTGASYNQYFAKLKKDVVMEEYIYNISNIFIIAEAGVNHNGDINLAKQLIDIAVEAKVDAVKFQTWKTELLVTKQAIQAEYQTENTAKEESQFEMLKRLELTYDDFRELKTYCDEHNIMFLSTPDEETSAQFLCELQDIFKIGSGELTNIPYLRFIGSLKKKVILSTGMGTLSEIEEAIATLVGAGTAKEDITILHATTQYPTPMQDVNLSAMQTIKAAFDIAVGYSDHTLGIEVPIAAVAMGATVIEKHFTIDTSMQGPDHKASLNPEELKTMVTAIRNIELAMGDGIKTPTVTEGKNKKIVRKVIVAKQVISKGDVFSEHNLTVKRDSKGIPANRWDEVLHQIAQKNYEMDEII